MDYAEGPRGLALCCITESKFHSKGVSYSIFYPRADGHMDRIMVQVALKFGFHRVRKMQKAQMGGRRGGLPTAMTLYEFIGGWRSLPASAVRFRWPNLGSSRALLGKFNSAAGFAFGGLIAM